MQAGAQQTLPDPATSFSNGPIGQMPKSGIVPKSAFSVDDGQGPDDDPDLEQGPPQKPQSQPGSRSLKQRLSGIHRQVAFASCTSTWSWCRSGPHQIWACP